MCTLGRTTSCSVMCVAVYFWAIAFTCLAAPSESAESVTSTWTLDQDTVAKIAETWGTLCPPVSGGYGYEYSFNKKLRLQPDSELMYEHGKGVYIRRRSLQWADVTTTFPATGDGSPTVIRTWQSIGDSQYYRAVQSPKGYMSVVESSPPLPSNRRYGFPELDVYSELRRFVDFTAGLVKSPAESGPSRDFWQWPVECREEKNGSWTLYLRRVAGKPNIVFHVHLSSLGSDGRLLGWDEGRLQRDCFIIKSSYSLTYSDSNGVNVPTAFRQKRYKRPRALSNGGEEDSAWVLESMEHRLTRILPSSEVMEAPMTIYLPPGSIIETLDGNIVRVRETGREFHAD